MNDYLTHHGIKGQKWGVRRFQNEDGSLTNAGKKRYSVETEKSKDSVDIGGGYKLNFETTTHTIKSEEGSDKAKKNLDTIAKNKDFDAADKEFDTKASKVMLKYETEGKDAALKMLKEEFKDYSYSMVIDDMTNLDYGVRYITYALNVFGNDSVYMTSGDKNYSDDQSFIRLK